MTEKGLPEYSIKGGLCNYKDCMKLCTVLCTQDGIWYCEEHAKEKVTGFLKAFMKIGGIA